MSLIDPGFTGVLERIAYGKQAAESLLELQERYDTYFQSSGPWNQARA
jgi:hypothetical protein